MKHLINGALGLAGLRLSRNTAALTRADLGLRQIIGHLAVSVIFDVGAHTGQYATRLRSIGYQGRIISFEPQSEAFAALAKRAKLDPRWEAMQLALGDQEREKVLNISRNSWSSSFLPVLPHILAVEPSIANVGAENVQITVLDKIFKNMINPLDKVFLKIDAQGYEPAVLAGAREFLSYCVAVQLELALLPSYQNQVVLPEMIDLMAKTGFRLVHLEPGFWDNRTGYLLEADGIFARSADLEREFPRRAITNIEFWT